MNAPSQNEDCELVRLSRKGDRDAFAQLMENYRHPLFALAYSKLRNYDQASEIVQDAFVQGYLAIERLRDPSKVGGWFYGIARKLILKRKQSMTRQPRPLPEFAAEIPAPQPPSEEPLERVRQAIAELPEELQEVLLLKYGKGMSYQAMASFLGIPWATVEGRLARGRERLREKLLRLQEKS